MYVLRSKRYHFFAVVVVMNLYDIISVIMTYLLVLELTYHSQMLKLFPA